MSRYWRMKGFDVLHPIGWDSFGLPAEQFAIQTGFPPAETTKKNIATFKRQLKMLGFSYDWDKELATTDVNYVRWTQWIFLQVCNKWLSVYFKLCIFEDLSRLDHFHSFNPSLLKLVDEITTAL